MRSVPPAWHTHAHLYNTIVTNLQGKKAGCGNTTCPRAHPVEFIPEQSPHIRTYNWYHIHCWCPCIIQFVHRTALFRSVANHPKPPRKRWIILPLRNVSSSHPCIKVGGRSERLVSSDVSSSSVMVFINAKSNQIALPLHWTKQDWRRKETYQW